MDLALFTLINGYAEKNLVLDWLGIFFAVYALFLLAGAVIIIGWKNRSVIGLALSSAIAAYLTNALLGAVFVRSRPFIDHSVHQLVKNVLTLKSFPSDHSALAFALAVTLTLTVFRRSWLGVCAILFALCIAVSRVFVGVHYPFDIIIGGLIGALWAILLSRLSYFKIN